LDDKTWKAFIAPEIYSMRQMLCDTRLPQTPFSISAMKKQTLSMPLIDTDTVTSFQNVLQKP
jgi:hypothetical protein